MREFLLDHLGRSVGGGVIDDDDFVLGLKGGETAPKFFSGVVADDDNAYRREGGGDRF